MTKPSRAPARRQGVAPVDRGFRLDECKAWPADGRVQDDIKDTIRSELRDADAWLKAYRLPAPKRDS
jgi:hypothetical protein